MAEIDLTLLNKPLFGKNLLWESSYQESFASEKNNRLSLNGEYGFIYDEQGTIDTRALEEDFDFENSEKITIPSHMEFNGYGKPQYCNIQYPWEGKENLSYDMLPKDNPCGIYLKDVNIELDENKDYILEFNGFESALYVYINGIFIGYSTQNYTRSQFRINNALKNGKNRFVFVVFKYSFASWISDQDMWRLSGIHRNVDLLIVDKTHIADLDVPCTLNDDYRTGHFSFKARIENPCENMSMRINLRLKENIIIEKELPFNKYFKYEENLQNILPWSDETPNLYTLDVELRKSGIAVENTTLQIGFRRIEIKGNQVLLNGKRLILRGVNRHEFKMDTGRVMDRKTIQDDLILMKKNNINTVRCSHYPNNVFLYEECDRLGIYVIDETAIETHGTWMNNPHDENCSSTSLPGDDKKYEEITLLRGKGMLERDKNHCSILFWSLGNESYAGENLKALSDYFHGRDKTRLVHYEGCFWNRKYSSISDVESQMYTKPADIRKFLKKHKDKPFMLCEYEHSMGNSTGNMDEYMKLLDEFDNFMLGCIWDFVDQGIKMDGKMFFGGDFNEYPHDDNFCADGILPSDRIPGSKMATVKYNYSPVRITFSSNSFTIVNLRSFSDTNDLEFIYSVMANGIEESTALFNENIEPGKSKEIFVPFEKENNKNYVRKVNVIRKSDKESMLLEIDDSFMNQVPIYDEEKSEAKLQTFHSVNHYTIETDDGFEVIFLKPKTGHAGLEAIRNNGELYLQNLVEPTLFRPNIDNDMTIETVFSNGYLGASRNVFVNPFGKSSFRIVEENSEKVVVRMKHIFLFGRRTMFFNEEYTIKNDKTITIKYSFKPKRLYPLPSIIGMRFRLNKDFSDFNYLGIGKEETYPDRFKGQDFGYHQSNSANEYVDYSMPQECGNHMYTQIVDIPMYGGKMSIEAVNKPFSFNYLPYSSFDIENAKRKSDLSVSKYNYLTISAFTKGVGGDDSWGAPVHKQYRAKHKLYTQEFRIRIK